mmetsp:Transcript_3858/g.5391  ORF Transcript_3858/g.5391 Transcript_3858/m.5391 type:complete len:238 (+) Transcript_3858:60-773(+)
MANDLERWWKELPIITKYLFASSFGLTLAANFGIINPYYIILDFQQVFRSLEIWRLATCFFFHGRLGFSFLIHMIFLVRYGESLEKSVFAGRTADYLFFILFGGTLLLVASFFLNFKILGASLIMMIIYLWSRKNPNVTMSFMFGLRFQSFYFPWVLVAFDVLMGGFPLPELVGILVGHVYFFLQDIYPATGGPRYLQTPQFLQNLFPAQTYQGNNNAQQPPNPQRQWGRGYTLGNQ